MCNSPCDQHNRLESASGLGARSAALPDSLHDTTTGEALHAIVDLDLDSLTDINPPRGYGRD
ncbi:MAG: hypothetical protein ACREFO_21305 [Acetobacteraceae bacterium]